MKKAIALLFGLFLAANLPAADEGKVIARWDFKDGKPVSADGKYQGVLRGRTTIVKDADGNSVLRIPAAESTEANGMVINKSYPELTPQGAFRLEIKFRPAETISAKKVQIMLWDSKYIVTPGAKTDHRSNSGFALALRRSGSRWIPVFYVGYGTSSLTVNGKPFDLSSDRYHTVSVDFSPGLVKFRVDGEENAEVAIASPGPPAKAYSRPTVGDRSGSNYWGFEGDIAEVTLSEIPLKKLIVSPANRTGFIRLESSPVLTVQLYNNSGTPMKDAEVKFRIREYPEFTIPAQKVDLSSGPAIVMAKIDSMLKPGVYNLEVILGNETELLPFFIAPERGDIYPVYMWGGGDPVKLHEVGFTHQLAYLSGRAPDANDVAKTRDGMKLIDDLLEAGVYAIDTFSYYRQLTEKFLRIRRDGKPYTRKNLDAANPEAVSMLVKRAGDTAKAYGSHPAFEAALIQSEVRDGSNPSFSGFEEKAYREYAGAAVPSEVNSRSAPNFRTIPNFPSSRVIPDDYPLQRYYSWWWRVGDGWNPLHEAISKEYHKYIKHKFMTFYDPAVRVPPQWGSGGDVDCISQWSYTNSDPIKVGQSTDEMLAMGAGNPKQKIMKMTQAFWYRSQTAPLNKKVENPPEWLAREPEAKFISISNDHLKIAYWSMISRKLDGIMYHGYSSLIEPKQHGYRFTNPELKNALKELNDNVSKPLGPVLKRIPERAPSIAMLESFTSTVFGGGHASFGWGRGWWADLHQALQWAHYQPAVIYDEHIDNGILNQVDVLILPAVEVLKESTFNAIREFQRKGGLVIGDQYLLPGILPDISIESVQRLSSDAAESKRRLQALGADIRKQLEPHWQSPLDCDNPDIVARLRTFENADYLFVINDKRTYGDYVGQWRMVQEQGLPATGTITLRRQAGAVYDLVTGRQVSFKSTAQDCRIPLDLKPGEGRLLLILDQPLGQTRIQAPESASPGQPFEVEVTVQSRDGKPVRALIPIELDLINPSGAKVPGSGFFCAENGGLRVSFTISVNEKPGSWHVIARNLADGSTQEKALTVTP